MKNERKQNAKGIHECEACLLNPGILHLKCQTLHKNSNLCRTLIAVDSCFLSMNHVLLP